MKSLPEPKGMKGDILGENDILGRRHGDFRTDQRKTWKQCLFHSMGRYPPGQ